MKVKRLLWALGLIIASGMMVLKAADKGLVYEGTFKGGTWAIYDDGELRIARSSKGAIPDYQDSQAPWAAHAEEVKWIYLDESKGKITRIGKWAFRDMEVDSIKQGNLPTNHLQLETLGKKAFNSFNVPSLYISGNKEMSRHTAINSTPILGFKNLETVWEYGLAGDHYMIDLGPDIKMLKAGSLACPTLWHDDGTPSVFIQAENPPDWQRLVGQGESRVWETIGYAALSIATGGIAWFAASATYAERHPEFYGGADKNPDGDYAFHDAYLDGGNPFVGEREFEYPFGDGFGTGGEIIVVVPPDFVSRYKSFYPQEHPEVNYGYMTASYYGEHSKSTRYTSGWTGRIVPGEPLYDDNGNLEGWWYAEEHYDSNWDVDGYILHIGYNKEVPSYADGAAPWSEYLKYYKIKDLYIHAPKIADEAFKDGKNITGILNIHFAVPEYTTIEIGKKAFYKCHALRQIGFESDPSVYIEADDYAFYECWNLQRIYDLNIQKMGEYCFAECSGIYGAKLGNTIMRHTMPKAAFKNCEKFYQIDLSELDSIGPNAFEGTMIKRAVLKSCRGIDDQAFKNCKYLTEVVFGNSAIHHTNTGHNVFEGCTALSDIHVPNLNRLVVYTHTDCFKDLAMADIKLHVHPDVYYSYYAGDYNFGQFTPDFEFRWDLAQGTINGSCVHWQVSESGVLTIDPVAYNGNYGAYSQYFYIPDYEFGDKTPWAPYHKYITKIMIGSVSDKNGKYYSIYKIGANAFSYANISDESQITDVHIPRGCTEIGEKAFYDNTNLVSIHIEDVEKIGSQAFAYCTSMPKIDLGDSLKQAGDYIFQQCTNLAKVNISNIKPAAVTEYTFAKIGNKEGAGAPRRSPAAKGTAEDGQENVTLSVPGGALNNYLMADYWNEFSFDAYDAIHGKIKYAGKYGDGTWILYEDSAMVITANNGPKPTEKSPFSDAAAAMAKSIEYAGKLRVVGGAYWFKNFANLESVSLPATVQKIGENAFSGCAKLANVDLAFVDTIERGAFEESGLTNVSLATTKVVGNLAFQKCKKLQSISLNSDADTQLGYGIFWGCTGLQAVDLGAAKLGSAMFTDCTGLNEVIYNGSELPGGVFSGCSNLSVITLGNQLVKIGIGVFDQCEKLDTIRISAPDAPAMKVEVEKYDLIVDDDLMSYSTVTDNPFGRLITGTEKGEVRWDTRIDHKKIHVVVPSLYEAAYKAAELWKEMIINDYVSDEMEFPITFAIGKKTSGVIDDKGNLKIVAYGDMDGNASAVAACASYIKTIEFDYPVSSTLDAADAANGLFAWMTQAPKSITFGALTKTIGAYGFYSDAIGPDVIFNCYAATPPTIYAKAFNWDTLTPSGKKPTLHVLKDADVVNAYKNAPGWYRFNVVGDLEKQKAPTQYTVTFIDGTSNGDVPVVIDEQIVDLGMSAVLPKAPNHVGYVFSGWEGNYTNVTNDELVIATYEYTTHKVNFFAYGQDVWESQTVEHGAAAQKPAITPEGKDGIIFDHWGWFSGMDSVIRDLNCQAIFIKNVPVTKVDIEQNIKSLVINKSELGTKTLQLTVTVLPTNALNRDVVWSSEKEEVATVDQNGLVTIQGFGECYIYATSTDGSGESDYAWIIVEDEEEVIVPVYATDLDLEEKEVTILLNQDPKLVYFTVTPEDYNGGIHFIPRGEMHTQVMQVSVGEQNAPAVYINADEFLKQKADFAGWTDTIDFRADMFDPEVTHYAPEVRMIVHILPDSIFTENSIEGVPVRYHVTDLDNKLCEVYGERKMLMMPDPETGLPFEDVPAIPATTTGKVTIPGSVRGFTVLRTHENAFVGCKLLEEVEFENGFQQFGSSSFAECNAMKTIRLPKSLKKLEPFCANGLQNLTNVFIRAAEPPVGWQRLDKEGEIVDLSETYAFGNINENAVLHVIKESKALYDVAPWTEWFKTVSNDLEAAYTVRFVDYDGTELSNQSVEHGENATAPVDPFHSGREFIGWDKPFTNVVSHLTVTAQYNITEFTVTFKDWDGSTIDTQKLEYGQSAVAPADPIRDGYVFTGWDNTFSNVTEDITVTAQYIQIFTVTFVNWNGKVLKSEEVEAGKSADAPVVPSRTGYVFTGWDQDFSNVMSNLTVKAQFKAMTFTVTFLDWDDTVIDTQTVNFGEAATAPADPVRDGYTFIGWDGDFDYVISDLFIVAKYEQSQDIDNVEDIRPASRKLMINGNLYIIRQDGAIYDARGARVK